MNARDVASDVWKWIAGSMVIVVIAFLTPSIGWFVDTRDQPTKAEIAIIRDRQLNMLIRLTAIETQLHAIQLELRRHEADTRR